MSPSLPIVGICGKAGAGKDVVAQYLVKSHGFVQIAWADPVKRMCSYIFDFSEDQLWGASENRNDVDPRFSDSLVWDQSRTRLANSGKVWLSTLLELPGDSNKVTQEFSHLLEWFDGIRMSYPELSPRIALQMLGTQWGRTLDEDLWVKYTMRTVRKLLSCDSLHWTYIRTVGLLVAEEGVDIQGVVISDVRFENELKAIPGAGGFMLQLVRPEPARDVGIVGHSSESEMDKFPSDMFNASIVNDGTLRDLYRDIDTILVIATD